MSEALRQSPQKLLVTVARVPPHDRGHRRVLLERRRTDRDPRAFQQPTIGQQAQPPAEYWTGLDRLGPMAIYTGASLFEPVVPASRRATHAEPESAV
jgi:hypothetical protein